MTKEKKSVSLKKVLLLFIIYTFTYLTVFAFIDYYAFYAINPFFLTVLAVLLGAASTYLHIIKGYKSYIDFLVKRIEK